MKGKMKRSEKNMEKRRITKLIMEGGEKDKFPPTIPPTKTSSSSSSSSSYHHHSQHRHHQRCLRPPPAPLPGILFIFCVLLSVMSLGDVARGQHLSRIPPAVIVISNPGERGLIPAQPFWPPQAPTTITTTAASIPTSTPPSQHARAHLNEVQTGVVVQDHGYRKAPPGANTPLPRLVLAALFRLAAEDQALTSQPAGATVEPAPVTRIPDTTNPASIPLKEEHTPFFLPSLQDPHLTPQLPTFPGTQFPVQPHTAAGLQPESLLQSLPPGQPHSRVEDVRPASLVKGGVITPTQADRVHQRQGHFTDGAALTHRTRHRQGVQPPLDLPPTAPPASFPGVKPGHPLTSANPPHLLGATQPPTRPLGRPLPTQRPLPRPRPLPPPTRLPPRTPPPQPSLQPTVSKGVGTTSDQSKSEEDYYYYYYSDEDYYYDDDYGNSASKDSGEQRTSPARPVGPPAPSTTPTTTTTTRRPTTKGPITLPPSFFGPPHGRRRPARPKPKSGDASRLLPLTHHAASQHFIPEQSSEETEPDSDPFTPNPEQHSPLDDYDDAGSPRPRPSPTQHFNPGINLGTLVGNGRYATLRAPPQEVLDNPHLLLALAGGSDTRRGGPVYFPAELGGLHDPAEENYDDYTQFRAPRRASPALQHPSDSKHQAVTTRHDTRPPSPPASVWSPHTPTAPERRQDGDSIVGDDALAPLTDTTQSRGLVQETEDSVEEQTSTWRKDEEEDMEQDEEKVRDQKHEVKHENRENISEGEEKYEWYEEEEEDDDNDAKKYEEYEWYEEMEGYNSDDVHEEIRQELGEERKEEGRYKEGEWRGEREKREKLWVREDEPPLETGMQELYVTKIEEEKNKEKKEEKEAIRNTASPVTKINKENEEKMKKEPRRNAASPVTKIQKEEEEKKKGDSLDTNDKPLFFSRLPLIGLTGYSALTTFYESSLSPSPSPSPQR